MFLICKYGNRLLMNLMFRTASAFLCSAFPVKWFSHWAFVSYSVRAFPSPLGKSLICNDLNFLLNISNDVSMELNARFCNVHLNPDYSNLQLFIIVYYWFLKNVFCVCHVELFWFLMKMSCAVVFWKCVSFWRCTLFYQSSFQMHLKKRKKRWIPGS